MSSEGMPSRAPSGRGGGGRGAAAGLAATGVVLLLLVLSASTSPLMTAALGCIVAALVGVRPDLAWARGANDRTPAGKGAPSRAATRRVSRVRLAPLASSMELRPALPITVAAVAGGLQVRWWRRDGHDRLYVTNSAGASLGWLDRSTGLLHVFDEGKRGVVEYALRSARSEADRRSA